MHYGTRIHGMKFFWAGLIAVVLFAALAAPKPGWTQESTTLLDQGIYAEETQGDLDAAIGIYERILLNAEANRVYAAQAQYRLGVCYAKKGLDEDAAAAFQKVIDRYADYSEVVGLARVRLANLALGTNGETLAMSTRMVWALGPTDPFESGITNGQPSPDGRYYSFNTGGNVAVRDLQSGEIRVLTDGRETYNSIWSPDSSQIAYSWYSRRDEPAEIRIVGLDGAEPRVLCEFENLPWLREWTQDGKYILAGGSGKPTSQFLLFSVADGSVRVLKSQIEQRVRGVSLSPDGRYLAYALENQLGSGSRSRDIFLLTIDTGREVALVEHPASDVSPYWAPDGKRIVFTSNRSGVDAVWMLEVDEGKPKGVPTLLKELGELVGIGGGPLTADGSFYYTLGTRNTDIYVATLDFEAGKVLAPAAKMPLRFEGSNFGLSWSPDGKYRAYISRRRGLLPRHGFPLVIQSLETGEERELSTKSLKINGRTQWASDGRSIIVRGYTEDQSGQDWGLHLVDVQTGDFTTIMQIPDGIEWPRLPVFSKDEKEIYDVRRDRSAILAYNLETHEEKELYRSNTVIPQISSVSPDGQRLAFIELESVEAARPAMVKTLSISGGEPSDLYLLGKEIGGIRGMVWTPHGDLVAIENSSHYRDKAIIIPAGGGDAREFDLEFEVTHGYSLHPDGQRIVFERGGSWSWDGIWVLENFLPASTAGK